MKAKRKAHEDEEAVDEQLPVPEILLRPSEPLFVDVVGVVPPFVVGFEVVFEGLFVVALLVLFVLLLVVGPVELFVLFVPLLVPIFGPQAVKSKKHPLHERLPAS